VRVLFIDHVEPDFLAAVTYMGLCQELGAENVVDWPWKHSYHGQTYKGPIPYPPPMDRGSTAPFPWMQPQAARAWQDEEVFARIGEFDLIVLASPRAYNTMALERLIACVGRGALRKLVLVDGEDYTATRWDYVERLRPSVYFKLSMVPKPFEVYHDAKARMAGQTRIVPFPLATPLGELPAVDKTIDVVFFGGRNWRSKRQEGVPVGPPESEPLKARLAAEFPGFVGGFLGYDEYLATTNRAKIAVCVGGSGVEPMRTYEILSCPGTLLVRERIEVIAPYPLVDGVHYVGFDGPDDLPDVIRRCLADEPMRARVAATGNQLLRDRYTPLARGRQLLEESFR
jgi:hypothetical protein